MHPPKGLQYLLPFWGCLPWSHDNHDDNYYDDDRWQGLGFVFLLLSLWSAFSSGRLGEPHAYPTQDWIPNNLRLQASVAFDKYQSKLTSMQERLEVEKELENCFFCQDFILSSLHQYSQDSGSLLYPSVTFCTKYIWQSFPGVRIQFSGDGWKTKNFHESWIFWHHLPCPKVLELLNKNKSLDFDALKAFAQEDYWSRDKVSMRTTYIFRSAKISTEPFVTH